MSARRAPRPAGAPTRVQLRTGTAVAAGGDAIARLPDGRVAFVEGALPGELVDAEVVDSRRDFARARAVGVLDASPERVRPPCPWARAGCGGCQWQHVEAGAQLAHKAAIVADALRRTARLDVPGGPPPAAVAATGYRTTLRLVAGPDGRPAFRHRRSHDPVEVDGCLIAAAPLADLVTRTRLRPSRGEVTLRVGLAGGERLVLPGPAATVVEAPVDAVVVRPDDPAAVVHEDAGGRRWRVSGRSFWQSGAAAAELLATSVVAAAGPVGAGTRLVDLYAGVGLLGGVLAAGGAPLVAVESSRSAAADARVNLADLDATVVEAEVGAWEPQAADLVVADPARPGLGRPGVAAVVATGAPRAVVVACDPASGARDSALLAAAGYRLASLAVLDLFPHTTHVEAVMAFERP